MSDVYGAFFDFSCMLKAKVDTNDPNATQMLNRVEAIQKACRDSGMLNTRRSYVDASKLMYKTALIIMFFMLLSILFGFLSIK